MKFRNANAREESDFSHSVNAGCWRPTQDGFTVGYGGDFAPTAYTVLTTKKAYRIELSKPLF
jgi:hypothetical protein